MSRNSISFIGRAAHRHNNSLSRVRMSRINRQRQSRLENPLMTPLHETERIALMNAVARIFVERHGTSQDFADAKVLEMTEADLLAAKSRFDASDGTIENKRATIDWICIHDRVCLKDSLPTEFGNYLVIRGHWMKSHSGADKGVVTYEIAVCEFHPNGYRHGGHWYDTGFFYTHWYGPISKPDMQRFPILSAENPCNNPPKDGRCLAAKYLEERKGKEGRS